MRMGERLRSFDWACAGHISRLVLHGRLRGTHCGGRQANAEPDMAQTGKRLRPLVAGLVEGTLALVADPLERSRSGADGERSKPEADAKCVEIGNAGEQRGQVLGKWVQAWDKRQAGRGLGSSGMRMM